MLRATLASFPGVALIVLSHVIVIPNGSQGLASSQVAKVRIALQKQLQLNAVRQLGSYLDIAAEVELLLQILQYLV